MIFQWVLSCGFFLVPAVCHAQFGYLGFQGGFQGFQGGFQGFQGGFQGFQGGFQGGGGGAAGMAAPTITRSTNVLPNPVNYWQYSQVTAVKPIIGTVRIYNTFGILGISGGGGLGQGFNTGFQTGGFGGFGGFGGGATGPGGQIPGIGATQGGDDPPQGVLLHVQYAQMFFPNQQQINQQAFQNPQQGFGGGFGGFGGGFPGGFGGKGYFGNGGSGL
jgi:hypothetical protein